MRLKSLIEEIRAEPGPTPSPGCYFARPIPGHEGHYVGLNHEKHLTILAPYSRRAEGLAPIDLAKLVVRFGTECEIVASTTRERGTFTSLVCRSMDPTLQEFFLDVVEKMLLGSAPQSLAETVRRLAALFQRLSEPPRKSAAGLFGELLVIDSWGDAIAAVSAWHPELDSRYDFAWDEMRLEVKTSSTRKRVHEFSAEQCEAPAGCVGFIASMFVERIGGGTTINDLMSRIERKLGGKDEVSSKLREQVGSTLGEMLERALALSFDEPLARDSLLHFRMNDIPAVRRPFPDGVTSVRFTADLARVTPATPNWY